MKNVKKLEKKTHNKHTQKKHSKNTIVKTFKIKQKYDKKSCLSNNDISKYLLHEKQNQSCGIRTLPRFKSLVNRYRYKYLPRLNRLSYDGLYNISVF